MYNNEVYFYQKISSIIECISIPKCYTCFKFEQKDVIVLEDLYKYNGCFNIDLNKNIKVLLNVVEHIFNMHNLYYFNNIHDIPLNFKNLKKPNEIIYYKELVNERFHKFMIKNKFILNEKDIKILNSIYENFDFILNKASEFPLSFCHGDLKSPNIFYYNYIQPYFLDWQYIQLNKGISDITFEKALFFKDMEKLNETYLSAQKMAEKYDMKVLKHEEYAKPEKHHVTWFIHKETKCNLMLLHVNVGILKKKGTEYYQYIHDIAECLSLLK